MTHSFSIVTTAAFLLLAGCGSPETTAPEMTDSEANTDDTGAALLDAREDIIGSWVSPSCGNRDYERQIQFDAGNQFVAQDLVSPCPPLPYRCFWSGIVTTDGRYRIQGNKIKLIVSRSQPGFPISFVEELLIEPRTRVPVEVSPQGERCPYMKAH